MSDISAQLVEQVADARSDHCALKIVGGDSKSCMLAREITGTPLKLSGHSGIVSYDPTELILSARAGTKLRELNETLDEKGQTLSFDPPHLGPDATLGGTLACNLSGPARPWSGSIRDMALGVRLINGRAEHLRFGGQVMKNVAGYDVTRLQAGALGSLGVITEISLKVLPKTQAVKTLCWELSQHEAIEKMTTLTSSAQPVSGAAWVDGVLYMRLAGAARGVEATSKSWGGDTLSADIPFWRDLREQQLDFFFGNDPLWRFSVRPTSPPMLDGAAMLIDWGGGQRWLRGDHDIAALAELATKAGGHVTLFKGGDRSAEVRHELTSAQRHLHENLKQAFDPDNILNPGALYAWM